MGGSLVVQAAANTAGLTAQRTKPSRNIVVIAVDESPQAEMAFKWYAKYVHKPGNYVRITHCKDIVGHTTLAEEYRIKGDPWDILVADAKEDAKPLLEKYQNVLSKHEMQGDTEVRIGRPGECIIDAARDHKASMIVMGTRGLGVIKRAILGSVSYYVISHANIPVTIVPDETRYLPDMYD